MAKMWESGYSQIFKKIMPEEYGIPECKQIFKVQKYTALCIPNTIAIKFLMLWKQKLILDNRNSQIKYI